MTGPITGRQPAAPLPNAGATGGFEPSGDLTVGDADGIRLDRHRTSRRVLTTLGVLGAGAGAAFLGANLLGRGGQIAARVPWAMPAAIGAAALGLVTVGIAQGALRARDEQYTQVVDGSLREAAAAADQLGGDVGIISAGDDRWGLMAVEDSKADAEGGGAVKLSNPPVRFAAVTSRDGDTWVRAGEDFVNRGSATAIEASSIDPANAAQVRELVGMRLAVTPDGTSSVTLGRPLLEGAPAASTAQMTERLFEAGIDDAVLLDTGRGVVAFAPAGNFTAEDLRARGTGVHPVGAVTLLSAVSDQPTTRTLTTIGGGTAAGELDRPVVDVRSMQLADAGQLTGRRIAGTGAGVDQLGAVVSTHANQGEAVAAAAARKERTLVVNMADGSALFDLPGAGKDRLITALGGGANALQVVQERKRFAVATDGTVTFAARSVPFDVAEPVGMKLDTGSVSGVATKHVGSYADRSAALAAIRGDLDTTTRYAIVDAQGPAGRFHTYELGGGDARAWDQELGSSAMGAWRNDHVRRTVEEVERHPSTWGTDLHYYDHTTERTVRYLDEGSKVNEVATSPSREVSRTLSHIVRAFNPNEAVGHTVSFGGRGLRIDQYLDSTNSASSAEAYINRSAGDPSAYVVLERENNRGSYHIYRATPGYSGNSWNENRADAEMASWVRDDSRTYEETERRQGQHGTDVYHYDVTESWRERVVHDGWSADVTDRTSAHRDRRLDYIDYADPPVTSPGDDGGGTSPGDDGGGSTSPGDDGGSTSPGDDGGSGWPGSGGSGTSPGDDGGSSGGSGGNNGGSSGGDSTDNGNPSEDDF